MNKRIDYTTIKNLSSLVLFLKESDIPENEYWLHIASYQELKARQKGIPLHGLFEITPFCNLNCKMCYVHLDSSQVNQKDILPYEKWEDIIRQAHSMGMMNATLSGGECLVYPKFDELYIYLRRLGIKTSIKTNGVLLDSERITFFKRYPPKSITVSLYGSSNDAYKRVTGSSIFDTVLDNLVLLKETDLPVSIAITPSAYMYEDLENIVRLVKELKYPCSFNTSLFNPREETGRSLIDLTPDEYARAYKILASQNESRDGTVSKADFFERDISKDSGYGLRCGAGRSGFNVSWNGLLTSCFNLNTLYISLLDYSFAEAWKQINEDSLSYPFPLECNNCAYDKICFNCAAFRSNGAEKGHCNPKVCERTKLFIKEGIYSFTS